MAPTEFAWPGPGGQRDGTGKGGRRASRRKIRDLGCATVSVMSRAAVLVSLFAVACSPGRSSPILPRAAPPTSSAAALELPAEEEPAEPLGEPVNVLWGGPSSIAVSSNAKGGAPVGACRRRRGDRLGSGRRRYAWRGDLVRRSVGDGDHRACTDRRLRWHVARRKGPLFKPFPRSEGPYHGAPRHDVPHV